MTNSRNVVAAIERKQLMNMLFHGRLRFVICTSDVELGHWVTGSVGHLGHLSRPGHRVIILTRCETRVRTETTPKKCKTEKLKSENGYAQKQQ